jgi:hypothetical protein
MDIERRKGLTELPPEGDVECHQKEKRHAHDGDLGTYRSCKCHGGETIQRDRTIRAGTLCALS